MTAGRKPCGHGAQGSQGRAHRVIDRRKAHEAYQIYGGDRRGAAQRTVAKRSDIIGVGRMEAHPGMQPCCRRPAVGGGSYLRRRGHGQPHLAEPRCSSLARVPISTAATSSRRPRARRRRRHRGRGGGACVAADRGARCAARAASSLGQAGVPTSAIPIVAVRGQQRAKPRPRR